MVVLCKKSRIAETRWAVMLFVLITIRSFPLSWRITKFATRVTRQLLNVEQELFTFPGTRVHHRFYWGWCCSIFSGMMDYPFWSTWYHFLFMLNFNDCTVVVFLYPFSEYLLELGNSSFVIRLCVVCSSIYGLWFPLWYLQTLLTR
jgi:hypothetical protein